MTAEDSGIQTSIFRNASTKASRYHSQITYMRRLPFPAIAIIVALVVVNVLVWAAVGIVLASIIGLPTSLNCGS